MSIEPGTRFGPYEIGKLLGAGGMGTVYEGTDTRLRRLVAIKVLNEHASDPERDLSREARSHSSRPSHTRPTSRGPSTRLTARGSSIAISNPRTSCSPSPARSCWISGSRRGTSRADLLQEHPAVIMMHLSSFAEPTHDITSPLQPNAQERTRSFLGYVGLAEPATGFVVYSRGFAAEHERNDWVADTERRFPSLKNRVQLMHIPGDEQATFRDPRTQAAVRDRVKRLLNLR